MQTNPVRPRTHLIEYVAQYIDKLPEDHEVNQAFGVKLVYKPLQGVGAVSRNVFLFNFPNTADADGGVQLDAPYNAALSRKPALCIVPLSGSAPKYAMGAYEPSFSILCRHEYPGRGYSCCQSLIELLNLRAGVFPQNGLIYAVQSQPSLMYDLPSASSSVFRAMFSVKVAERIR